MIDLLGATAVGGTVAGESAKGLKNGLNMVQQNNLINKINLLVMDMQFKENKKGIKKSDVSYNLDPLNWNIYSDNSASFTLVLDNIDKSFCTKLVGSLKYKSVQVNNQNQKSCQDKNNIKFIF